ncbi:uncharacterized protein LOC129572190 [Sitodiplosis mosellana]|uniref:uncharacterized protein LOC129572190 n=1 Tax=Sitodiplosis mosellana TaxID=263140 RepID=UPI002443CFFE|nr:uncharacterized protein LOC129572190 [Sitodiplosis mosellana]
METSLFLVFVILCGCSINAGASATQIQSFNTNETNLTDLEQMDFRGLVYAANISEEFSLAAADVFRRKFANRYIQIEQGDDYEVQVSDGSIIVYRYEETVLVLKHFGSHILDLRIMFYDESDQESQLKQIITLLNQKCSNLTKLSIYSSENWDTLEDVQRIFYTVKDLAFFGRYNKLGSETLNLNEMFPNVRSLTLRYVELKDYDSVNITLPNLRIFRLEFMEISDRFEFKNFI